MQEFDIEKIECEMCEGCAENLFIGRTDESEFWLRLCQNCTSHMVQQAENLGAKRKSGEING